MASFGIMKGDDSERLSGALMIVDDRAEADEIAWELNRRGQDVVVREVRDSAIVLTG
jgi:hypothetical protein